VSAHAGPIHHPTDQMPRCIGCPQWPAVCGRAQRSERLTQRVVSTQHRCLYLLQALILSADRAYKKRPFGIRYPTNRTRTESIGNSSQFGL
jgi:hypothetical protein